MNRTLGVCSWSLQPSSADDLALGVKACGLSAVQLALGPLRRGEWPLESTRSALDAAGIAIVSGMTSTRGEDYSTLESIRESGGLRPDVHWPANLQAAREEALLAARLGLGLVSLHAGFLPEDPADPERAKLIERLRILVDVFASEGVRIAFETGQERADTLLAVLAELDRPAAGVNFDPANMILYDMGDPIEALRALAPRVAQIHVKDALRTRTPGTWGSEVACGTGQVDWEGFFGVLRERSLSCDLIIEREAGDERVDDVRKAAELVRRHLGAGTAT
jgi:sugar phosphate isomerase/epimerase